MEQELGQQKSEMPSTQSELYSNDDIFEVKSERDLELQLSNSQETTLKKKEENQSSRGQVNWLGKSSKNVLFDCVCLFLLFIIHVHNIYFLIWMSRCIWEVHVPPL